VAAALTSPDVVDRDDGEERSFIGNRSHQCGKPLYPRSTVAGYVCLGV